MCTNSNCAHRLEGTQKQSVFMHLKVVSACLRHCQEMVRLSIDYVTCDVMPGSMRTQHSKIHCSFARQFARAPCLVRACTFKTPVILHRPCMSHRLVQYSSFMCTVPLKMNQSIAFVVNKVKHLSHHLGPKW